MTTAANNDSGLLLRASATAQVFVDDLASCLLSNDDAHHLFVVRRVRDGELIVASDGAGSWRLTTSNNKALEINSEIFHEQPPTQVITVAFAPIQGERSDWAVTKLTELGCDRIVALTTDRSVVRWSESAAKKALARWNRLAREACCQSRRVRLPLIEGPVDLKSFIGPQVAMAVPGAEPLKGEISTVLVGPEGGWSEKELSMEFTKVTLGLQILRTETAAIVAGVLIEALRAGTVSSVDISNNHQETAAQ